MSGPDDAPRDGEEPRRYLIATAVARYPKCADWDRPGLVEAREQVIELFTQQLGYHHYTALGLDPTRSQLTEQLRAFCTSQDRREDDLIVLYLSGHGEVLEDGHEHVLLMADTDPADVAWTSLPTADLVRALRGTKVRRLLLMLDTCYSGQGGNELAAAALERLGTQWGPGTTSPGLVVVSSAQPHQQAMAGLFPQLLSEAVGSQATAGHTPVHLSVSTVVQQMNDHPGRPGYQHISLSLLGLSGEPPDFLTNPRHDVRLTDVDLALQDAAEFDAYALQRETEFTTRLLVRAMGYHGDPALGWWFCGRHRVLDYLAAWLNHPGDGTPEELAPSDDFAGEYVRVVTAGPGSGKTAVLGLVGALTMPDRRRTIPIGSLGLDPNWIPGEGTIDVIMYAQNLTDSQVLAGLAAAAGFRCTTVGEFLETLEHRNQGRGRPFTVLIDALDEAATPATLCSQIVRPLIEHSRGRIRLLLGTRPYLLDCLGLSNRPAHRGGPVIDLDSDRYADHEALLAYTIRNLLQSRPTSPYRQWENSGLLRPVAEAVAAAAGMSFLVARFAAYTLASADIAVTDPFDARWRASLPRHAGQAMRDDLNQRLGPDAQRATDLLRPLAYAEGQGLPWEDIWAPLASAISGRPYTDDDLLWLRRNAGSYVVEATENGRSAYRLYHQALTEHLREDTDPAPVHAAFVDTLTGRVPYRGDATRDWSRAHPYTLHHLATHAAAADCIDGLLSTTEYLVHADPHSLATHLQGASSSEARLTAAVYRTSFDRHATAPTPVRRDLLALNAARAGANALLEQLNRHAQTEWTAGWATGKDFSPALRHTLTGLGAPASAVACTVLDGHPVAVIGLSRGVGGVAVWDLTTGRLIGEPIEVGAPVSVVACTVLDGRPIAVIGTNPSPSLRPGGVVGGGGMGVRDLTTGAPIGEPLTQLNGSVSAMACTVLDGRPVAVIGLSRGFDSGEVVVRDVATGAPIGEPLTQHDESVSSVACTVLDGHPIAVIGTNPGISRGRGRHRSRDFGDGRLVVRDVATGAPIGEPIEIGAPVSAVACTVLDGRPVAVIGSRGGVMVRDVATGVLIGEPIEIDESVSAVACTVLDGRPVAVIGLGLIDEEVIVRDVATGAPIGQPIEVGAPVSAVACTVLDGRPITIAIGYDVAVRMWELPAHAPLRGPSDISSSAQPSAVACTVLDGRPVAVIGLSSRRSGVVVRDVATGALIGEPIEIGVPVSAVACTVLDGRPVAVIGLGFDLVGQVVVRDVATGAPIGEPLTQHDESVSAMACTVLDGRPVAVIGLYQTFLIGSHDDRVVVRDVATGVPIGEPIEIDESVSAVACTVLDGRPVAVIGSRGGVVVRDVATGVLIGEPIEIGVPVSAVACTVLDGRPVAVIGSRGGVVVRDVATGVLIGEPIEIGVPVSAVACTVLDGRPVAVIGSRGGVVVRDVATGVPIGEPIEIDESVSAVACTVLDGRPIAVIGGWGLNVWDLRVRKLLQRLAVPSLKDVGVAHDGSLVAILGRDVAVFRHRFGHRPV
ncbi:caspase family protein [Streptomyces prunicolor]|uniref:caspase family protein n=1 Tax=Streptomyces prunicolor TaxID=67348 RepID=UPI00371CC7C9